MNLFKLKYHDVSEKDLMKAIGSDDTDIKLTALRHPKATVEILHKGLEDHQHAWVKAALKHPKTTLEMLNKGLNDPKKFVREAAVRHPKATEEMLRKGLNDRDWYVREAAQEQLKQRGLK